MSTAENSFRAHGFRTDCSESSTRASLIRWTMDSLPRISYSSIHMSAPSFFTCVGEIARCRLVLGHVADESVNARPNEPGSNSVSTEVGSGSLRTGGFRSTLV